MVVQRWRRALRVGAKQPPPEKSWAASVPLDLACMRHAGPIYTAGSLHRQHSWELSTQLGEVGLLGSGSA